MKLKLRLSQQRKAQVTEELNAMGVAITEEASLILTEEDYGSDIIYCRDDDSQVPVRIADILYIESLGKEVHVHTGNESFLIGSRLYELEAKLPSELFLRISNSVIIHRNAIKRVKPALSQKFYLTLQDGATVDVTRSYYYKFKDYFGI